MTPPREHDEPMSSSNTTTIYNEQSSLLPQPSQDQQLAVSSQSPQPTLDDLARARRLLYLSHLFAQFSEGAWQFCLILFMAAFCHYESLILVSSYGLVSNGSVCVWGAKAGRFVDAPDNNRLFVAQVFILTENLCVVVASVFCYFLLARTTTTTTSLLEDDDDNSNTHWWTSRLEGIPLEDAVSMFLLVGIHLLGAAAMILDRGFMVAMERDWIVVMSQYAATTTTTNSEEEIILQKRRQEERDWLSQTNVAMKQIDLSCKVAAPAVAGFLIAAFDKSNNDNLNNTHNNNAIDLRGAALVVGAINAAALVVEYICTARIYQMLPALAFKKGMTTTSCTTTGEDPEVNQQESQNGTRSTQQVQQPQHANDSVEKPSRTRFMPQSLQIYLDQPISMGGVSLSLLYLNVLSFGGIMTAYLVWRGMRMDTVGVWRGVSSAIGLMGTFAYHFSSKRTSLWNTGMWSITYQFVCLSMSYISLFVGTYTLSLALLILGVCSSRIGLWVFDIAITQLMQEYIPDGVRGVVGGVQQSLNSFFFLLSFGLGIVFPDPKDFYIYVGAGYASVFVALILYAFKIYTKRDSFVSTF